MRVLMVAPFARGRGQGGSQRATAIAERLGDRGVELGWLVVPRRDISQAAKLRALLRLQPTISRLYEPPPGTAARGWDVAIVAHSYLMPALGEVLADVPTIVDFHNLEWQHLADGGHAGAGPAWLSAIRDGHVRCQVALMRRLERTIVRTSDLGLFVSEAEHNWASTFAPTGATMLLRSVLPRSEERTAAAIRAARRPESGHLAYVGTLTFPTNLTSLERFLSRDWPEMRAAVPGLRLTVAGACDPDDRDRLDRHPGVRALGFVDDLEPVLARCQAVVMPFQGIAGTSLRALFYALAGLAVIGSEQAFRGIDFPAGRVARDPADWASAVRELVTEESPPAVGQPAWERALAQQRDPEPWDRLVETLERLSAGGLRRQSLSAAAPTQARV
jgi:hypothetical protein